MSHAVSATSETLDQDESSVAVETKQISSGTSIPTANPSRPVDSRPVDSRTADNKTAGAESRLDLLRDKWTIFAPKRDQRPQEFHDQKAVVPQSLDCPFCSGNECQTPPPVWIGNVVRTKDSTFRVNSNPDEDADKAPWNVRVVPNKYPAVSSSTNGALADDGQVNSKESGLFQSRPVFGGHEVVVESKRHCRSLTDMSVTEAELVFRAYRDRLDHYRNDTRVKYTNVFKNVGQQAGASLSHSHSQIVAANLIPRSIQRSFDLMKRHRATTGCCLMCDMVREERRLKDRVITHDDHSVAYCPFASHLPMLVRVTTLQHQACYEDLSDQAIHSVSRMVYQVISWLEKLRPGTAYNYCLSTKPSGIADSSDAYHWSIDIFPRMTQVAGFEWASGCMINPVLPEDAARQFRFRAIANDPRRTL